MSSQRDIARPVVDRIVFVKLEKFTNRILILKLKPFKEWLFYCVPTCQGMGYDIHPESPDV